MAFGDTIHTNKANIASGEASVTISFTPVAGNLLVFGVGRSSSHGAGGAWSTGGAPSGWTAIHDSGINTGGVGGAWWWKISDGTETSVATSGTNAAGTTQPVVIEIEGPFSASPFDVAAEDVTNLSSIVTSQSTGTTGTTAQNDELAIAFFAGDRFDTLDGSRVYSNSFTEVVIGDGASARGTSILAKKVLSATGTVTCTFSCTDTGDEMYGSVAVFKKLVGGSPYTLTASAGSYGLTGNTASLLWKHLMAAVAGSYALAGNAASLLFKRKLTANAGAYALTGNNATLRRTYILVSDAGSYVLTGNAASLLFKRLLVAGAGAYVLTGNSVTLIDSGGGLTHYTITADAGSYALTGNSASLLFKRVMAALAGSYSLSGQDASLLFKRVMSANAGAYALSGNTANLLFGHKLNAVAGIYTLTGNNISFGEIFIAHNIYIIRAENRVYVIPFEAQETIADRTFIIPAESRLFEVAHD